MPDDRAGFYVDDHWAAKALILSGHAIGRYQLDYFTEAELNRLAFAPVAAAPYSVRAYVKAIGSSPDAQAMVEGLVTGLGRILERAHRKLRARLGM